MTISRQNRSENVELALQIIGEHYINDFIDTPFEIEQPIFKDILPTTWEVLVEQQYLSQPTIWHCRIAPMGWKKALQAIGKFCDSETKERLGVLCAALKKRIERTPIRATGALVGFDEIVTETGLPDYWISNVIDSHLIADCLNPRDVGWAPDDRMKSVVEIPIDFGHPH